jgi:hypothetical protein
MDDCPRCQTPLQRNNVGGAERFLGRQVVTCPACGFNPDLADSLAERRDDPEAARSVESMTRVGKRFGLL